MGLILTGRHVPVSRRPTRWGVVNDGRPGRAS